MTPYAEIQELKLIIADLAIIRERLQYFDPEFEPLVKKMIHKLGKMGKEIK